jgi:hypothetical protein
MKNQIAKTKRYGQWSKAKKKNTQRIIDKNSNYFLNYLLLYKLKGLIESFYKNALLSSNGKNP